MIQNSSLLPDGPIDHTESLKHPQKRKKFLFISPFNHYANGCRQLAAVLLEEKYLVKVLAFKKFLAAQKQMATKEEMRLLAEYLNTYQPDFIGVSLASISPVNVTFFFDFLRQHAPQAILACGGFGPTFDSERYLNAGADYALRGEGEGTLLDVARAIHTGEDLRALENICYLENGQLVINPLRPLISDLGTLPPYMHGDAHFIIIENDTIRYCDSLITDDRIYNTMTSRGCFGKCTYCGGGNWLKIYKDQFGTVNRYRTRPVENVMLELEEVKKSGVAFINFFDEYFVRPEEEFYDFCNQYKQRIDIPYLLLVHSEFIEKDEKRFKALMQSGIWITEMGIQSANQHISKKIFQRPVTLSHQYKAICKFHKHRINTAVDIIVAHALEGEAEYMETLEFIKSLPFDPSWPFRTYIQVNRLFLLPGAPISSMFPILKEQPIPEKIARHKILMAHLRHMIKDDDFFYSIYRNPYFLENPNKLFAVCSEVFYRLYHAYWDETTKRLAGREVYFWVRDEWYYHTNKYRFLQCKPKAILENIPHSLHEPDGLTVYHPDDILLQPEKEPIPIIIFGYTSAPRISKNCLLNYPAYNDLITCCLAKPPAILLAAEDD